MSAVRSLSCFRGVWVPLLSPLQAALVVESCPPRPRRALCLLAGHVGAGIRPWGSVGRWGSLSRREGHRGTAHAVQDKG